MINTSAIVIIKALLEIKPPFGYILSWKKACFSNWFWGKKMIKEKVNYYYLDCLNCFCILLTGFLSGRCTTTIQKPFSLCTIFHRFNSYIIPLISLTTTFFCSPNKIKFYFKGRIFDDIHGISHTME